MEMSSFGLESMLVAATDNFPGSIIQRGSSFFLTKFLLRFVVSEKQGRMGELIFLIRELAYITYEKTGQLSK
jgi:hypothetical protein